MNKQEGGWWRGDYGGKKQHWFPANFVVEVEAPSEADDQACSDQMPLGTLQKGSLDIVESKVDH